MRPCHNRVMVTTRAYLLCVLMLLAIPLKADDGAASIAAGGLVVMKREPRITMAKEISRISVRDIVVDYDFRNDSNEDVTTEVAFPIPDYDHDLDRSGRVAGFDDFKLWVNGSPKSYEIEARAFLKDKDYTQMLINMHVDVASFAHVPIGNDKGDIERLTAGQREALENVGLLDRETGDEPQWVVRKKYHWKQLFPAHQTVHIRHEYSPVLGSENSIRYGMGNHPDSQSAEEIKTFCLDGRLHQKFQQIALDSRQNASYVYVDFILTTANTWRTPIEDFTLLVERANSIRNGGKGDPTDYVSFCWDGPITKIDANHFSAHVSNFVPSKELRIGFFNVRQSNSP